MKISGGCALPKLSGWPKSHSAISKPGKSFSILFCTWHFALFRYVCRSILIWMGLAAYFADLRSHGWSWTDWDPSNEKSLHGKDEMILSHNINTGDLPTPIHQLDEKRGMAPVLCPIGIGFLKFEIHLKFEYYMNYDMSASAQECMRPSAVDRLFTRRSRLHGFSEVAFQTHTLEVLHMCIYII